MMRTKDEAVEKFKLYQKELEFYGYRVHHLHSDRGSEFFSQEGELIADRDRSLSALDEFCSMQSPMIKHIVTPVAAKEKIAEGWFKDHFDAADAMLFEARLSVTATRYYSMDSIFGSALRIWRHGMIPHFDIYIYIYIL
jgi:hypothetical protein